MESEPDAARQVAVRRVAARQVAVRRVAVTLAQTEPAPTQTLHQGLIVVPLYSQITLFHNWQIIGKDGTKHKLWIC